VIQRPRALDAIRRALRRSPIVVLTGPREAGETSLAREFVQDDSPNHFGIQDPSDIARLDDPMNALSPLESLRVLDEVRCRPEPVLRALADRGRNPARFLILASASGGLPRQGRVRALASDAEAPVAAGQQEVDLCTLVPLRPTESRGPGGRSGPGRCQQGVTNPHDALFRRVFADPAAAGGLFRHALPEPIVRAIDWDSLVARPSAQIDPALGAEQPDLVFEANLVDRTGRVVLFLEHKSFQDQDLLLQVLRYGLGFWLDPERSAERPLPAVIPLVVHHGPRPWRAPKSTEDLLGIADRNLAAILAEASICVRPTFDDLATCSEAELLARPLTAIGRLALVLLQVLRGASPDAAAAALLRWAPLLREVQAQPGGDLALETVGSYILETTELPAERLRALARRILGPLAGERLMSTAEKLRAEGRIEGRSEGRSEGLAEGRSEGKIELLLRQAQHRFGPLTEEVSRRLRSCSESELDAIGERLLDAESLDEAIGD
jgi:hypothetical protein